jgi:hypothetical protein
VNVFFDNCTAPVLASTLHGFITHEGHAAFHIKDIKGLPKGRHTADIDWINFLRNDLKIWMFISGDGRILKNPAERAALRSAGLHGFVLAPAYQRTPLNQVAGTLIWRWPELLQVTELLTAPSMNEIPIGKNTKLRQLPL